MGNKVQRIYVGTKLVYPTWKPSSNTIGYWKLESNGNDYSGNNNNFTNYSGITYSTLSSGKKYAIFSGVSSGNTCKAYTDSTSITNYGTFSVWAKPENNGGSYPGKYFLFTSGKSQGDYDVNFRLITAWYGVYTVNVNDASHAFTTYQSAVSPIVDGNWHHFVVTVSPSTVSLYIDRTLVGSGSNVSAAQTGTGNICLGTCYWDNAVQYYGFKGGLSECIYEKSVWTAQDVKDYYDGTKNLYS